MPARAARATSSEPGGGLRGAVREDYEGSGPEHAPREVARPGKARVAQAGGTVLVSVPREGPCLADRRRHPQLHPFFFLRFLIVF